MHDALYENQDELGLPLYIALAEALDLSETALREALEKRTFRPKVRSDFMGGLKSGANDTPTFFINGKRHDGASDFDSLATAGHRRGAGAARDAELIAPEKVVLRRGITRRHLLGAAGLGGLAFLAKPAWSQAVLGIQPPRGQALTQPPEIRSENGVLNATLTASPGLVRLGEFAFPGFVYNDAYIPPLLRVRPGDTMRIGFRNQLPDDPSNLHYHGMSVSPQGNSDNVFVHVHPGAQFDYEVRIPGNGRQGPGLFWYHPHAHGFVAKQILGGMSGGLVVEGSDRRYPILAGLPERFFLIKHAELGEGNEIISINGQLNPLIDIRPGEMQFWRIAHIGATLFIKFRIDGMPLYVVARDGHPLTQPQKVTEVFIGPGERIDAIAVGPDAGEYAVMTIPFQNEAWKKPDPAQKLATVASGGGARPSSGAESEILNQRVEGDAWIDTVRATPIARRRELTYSRTPDRKVFMIDHRVMEEDRIDQTAKLGDTEEWTVINTDQQYHSFHIHQTGFLVTAVNGVPQRELSLRDTVSIPPATDQSQGVLKLVIPFTDPVITGRFVYHCHAVDHEDKGMMGVIEVVG